MSILVSKVYSAKFGQELNSGHSKINFRLLALESFNNGDGVAEPSRRVDFHLWLFSSVECRRNPIFVDLEFAALAKLFSGSMPAVLLVVLLHTCCGAVYFLLAVLLHTCYGVIYFCTCRRFWLGI